MRLAHSIGLAIGLSAFADDETKAPPFIPDQPQTIGTNSILYGVLPMPSVPQLHSDSQLSPAPATSFAAWVSTNAAPPPDTCGAVGPNHVVTMLNTRFVVQDRSGTVQKLVRLRDFWPTNAVGSYGNIFDPRILYDPYYDRWSAAVIVDDNTTDSSILLGVSQTPNPTNSWYFWRIKADPANPRWADHPRLAFNKKWIVVQANLFPITTNEVSNQSMFWVFNKTNAYAGTTNYTKLAGPTGSLSHAPAVTYDPSSDVMYVLSTANGYAYSGQFYYSALRLLRISGSIGSEVLDYATSDTDRFFVVTNESNFFWQSGRPETAPNFGPQLGVLGTTNSHQIHLGDHRMQTPLYRNGRLWAVNVGYRPETGTPTRTEIFWWELNPESNPPVISRKGKIDGSASGTLVAYPSIAVNAFNDLLIGFSTFSSTGYASAEYVFKPPWKVDPLGRRVVKGGESFFRWLDSSSTNVDRRRNRWGDYSATVVDPVNDRDFWTIQEYASSHAGDGYGLADGRWGTYWARLAVDISPNDDFAAPVTLSGSLTNASGVFVRPSKEAGEPVHLNNSALGSIWFRWTAPFTGQVTVNSQGSGFQADLAVYTGSTVTNLILVADSRDTQAGGGGGGDDEGGGGNNCRRPP